MASNFTAPVLDTISDKCFPVPAHGFLPAYTSTSTNQVAVES